MGIFGRVKVRTPCSLQLPPLLHSFHRIYREKQVLFLGSDLSRTRLNTYIRFGEDVLADSTWGCPGNAKELVINFCGKVFGRLAWSYWFLNIIWMWGTSGSWNAMGIVWGAMGLSRGCKYVLKRNFLVRKRPKSRVKTQAQLYNMIRRCYILRVRV